ncbi:MULTISPECIES: NUDIX domain-containing protein [unclassified Rathayibacter]|uniref:NUDIX domain-containing protein n=1 Tax=unclassified Rathayibacter TaxID=2609250 RepID=UPI00188B4FF5|nr:MULTISPECIES: NUDIX domain-containing protein [unclassified Rathayibacter]MBF4462488.1 NUDIX domain-containing protein [Rathayibacter sp. VKM Ac-2879]MBF4503469.1 NUDIX domain-containing protein [Rathayibacter sp. VKM Ac-2878]
MAVTSAGILLHREVDGRLHVFLGRMGGPLWTRRPRAWSIPKGMYGPEETPFDAARREFEEEIGVPAPDVDYTPLGAFRQNSRKIVTVFAGPGDDQTRFVSSNAFELEWPRGSGVMHSYSEIETASWIPLEEARELLVAGQVPALDALAALLAS